ncbi:MAG TPA: transglycosylase domain-containing protein [Kofleriaceae bacterium]|nr:transglycosylase domain-containing protein [Kofleriaceae bacterium]
MIALRLPERRRFRWPLLAVAGAFNALVLAWFIAVHVCTFPSELLAKADATSLRVVDANGILLRQEATSAGTRERWMPLDRISPYLVSATLASEDNDFFEHDGVDWTALARATWLNLRGGGIEFGGSTITMQLVRLTAGTSRSARGKLEQLVLAARLERTMGKRDILEQYLNRVYYGHGAWGAEQAAQVYFGKHAADLAVGEAAFLSVLPRGPTYYDPFRFQSRVMARRSHILALMEEKGRINAFDRALAERVPLDLDKHKPGFRAPHFVEMVKDRLPPEFAQGAQVQTTLDWALQRQVQVALETHLDHVGSRHVGQAALVVMRNSDGAILALVGSRDYHDDASNGAFNGATARLRPGSTLKPFVYGAAFERGDTPATIALDLVLSEDTHETYSTDVKSHGFARYRESLAGSYNLSAVHTLQRVGVETVLKKLRTAGLVTLDRADEDYDWGLAIGHAETRLIDLTSAFSFVGRGGKPIAPRLVETATAVDGHVWRELEQPRPRVFSEEVSYLLWDILSDPDARKPMFGDRVPMELPFKVALKTGTTKAYTDLWAIGVTREYTVGVWAGNFDGSPTYHVMSVDGATPLVRATYAAIAARFGAPTAPDRPDTIVSADICPVSGMRPGPHCEHRKREVFIRGQVPTETCNWHQIVCGAPALVYPPEIRPWASYYGRPEAPSCGEQGIASGPLRITSPANGARFLLEPYRPATQQRPLLASSIPGARFTIDGSPAEQWVPVPGTHHVVVTHGDEFDEVTITYE